MMEKRKPCWALAAAAVLLLAGRTPAHAQEPRQLTADQALQRAREEAERVERAWRAAGMRPLPESRGEERAGAGVMCVDESRVPYMPVFRPDMARGTMLVWRLQPRGCAAPEPDTARTLRTREPAEKPRRKP